MDYGSIGFKAGLEIHQQLDTKKLFCNCPSKISDKTDYSFYRFLRPTQSELGEVDKAAIMEMMKGKRFLYTASRDSTCLVEADEEPPHEVNREALDVALTVSILLNAEIVDEIQVMRKIVIDGSNTSGFQRTSLIALHGYAKDVGIESIALEEDAARKIKEDSKTVNYGLDRLGIPLIEVATSADIRNPKHAREVAEYIGSLLQSTGKCKRGLGTIRQDLNISIREGSRVEIKGIQSLSGIEKVAEIEVFRQLDLIKIKKELESRGIKKDDIENANSIEVSDVLANSDSKIVKKSLSEGKKALAIKLPGFSGLLKREYSRLGKEFAVHARIRAGLGGIIHSDELPGYGINKDVFDVLKKKLGIEEKDAFAIFLGRKDEIEKAIEAVKERAVDALYGVPEEVRRALPDFTTEYMRPLPGAARMYPETDIPPVRITREKLELVKDNLPEKPEEKLERLKREYKLNEEQLVQLMQSGYVKEFESFAKRFPELKNTILRTFLNHFPELEKEGIAIEEINEELLEGIFLSLNKGLFAKEGIPEIIKYLITHRDKTIEDAIDECGLKSIDKEEVRRFIRDVIEDRKEFVEKKRESAFAPLMGVIMKELRGKVDGKIISEILKEELSKAIYHL
ncbi:MAG TPA: Glu-tRNA(Gln) amidotransferase subunit GatE [Thermoplasmatales archaeon]|nr:Glu-tRNA(Gln) amidotransferase subunit GatE [Thermoplasmatales archaeon]